MSVKCKHIAQIIEDLAPKYLSFKGDNTGLLIGDEEAEVSSILMALDINDDIIDEAIERGCNMIVTHHPIIFHPLRTLNSSDFKGRMILRLVSAGINAYSAHTNLDAAKNGISDYLAKSLGLSNISPLGESIEGLYSEMYDGHGLSYGRIGYLDPQISLRELCNRVKKMLKIDGLNVAGDLDSNVSRVGLCSGDGSDFIKDAYESGCDVYISGDIRYHDVCDAVAMGLSIIDAGHFATENIYIPVLGACIAEELKCEDNNINIIVSEKSKDPFTRF